MTRPESATSVTADAPSLERDLAESGLALRVEARAALAVLVGAPDQAHLLLDAATRGLVQRLARARGFTHCALELGVPGS